MGMHDVCSMQVCSLEPHVETRAGSGMSSIGVCFTALIQSLSWTEAHCWPATLLGFISLPPNAEIMWNPSLCHPMLILYGSHLSATQCWEHMGSFSLCHPMLRLYGICLSATQCWGYRHTKPHPAFYLGVWGIEHKHSDWQSKYVFPLRHLSSPKQMKF